MRRKTVLLCILLVMLAAHLVSPCVYGQGTLPGAPAEKPVQAYVIDRVEKSFSLIVSVDDKMRFTGRRIWVVVPGWPFRGGRVDFALFALLGSQDDQSKRESVFSSSQNVMPVDETLELAFDIPDLPDGQYLARAKVAMYGTEKVAGFEATREQIFIRGSAAVIEQKPLEKASMQVDGYRLNQTGLSRDQAIKWKKMLQDVASVEIVRVFVEGHTCRKGTSAANEIVAIRRAQKVVEILREMGIDEKKIQIVSLIDSALAVSNEVTEEAALKNRRVVVRLLFQKKIRSK